MLFFSKKVGLQDLRLSPNGKVVIYTMKKSMRVSKAVGITTCGRGWCNYAHVGVCIDIKWAEGAG
jgi:hypothetical protein